MAGVLDIGTLVGAIELEDKLTPALKYIDDQLNRAGSGLDKFGGLLSNVGSIAQKVGGTITAVGDRLSFLTLPLAAAAGAAIKFSTSFEQNMVKTVTVAGLTEDAMRSMREEILQISPDLGRGPVELSKALYAITSVGIHGAEALEILKKSAQGAAVGLGETEGTARALVAAVTAYSKEGLTAADATDKLYVAIKEGGAEADQFTNTLGRVVGTAEQVGISFDEVVSSVATFTRLGVKADEAVTALRGTIAMLMKPSEGARDMLKSLGTSIQEVRDKVKKDGLADTLIELVKLTKGNDDALAKIIPNVRALAGVLANAGAQAGAYRQILDDVKGSHGKFAETVSRTTETAAFKFDQLAARVQVLAIQLGDRLAPTLLKLVDAATPVFDMLALMLIAFGKLPEPIQTVIIALTGLTLIAGPLASFGGRFIEIIGLVIGPRGLGGLIKYFTATSDAAAVAAKGVVKLVDGLVVLEGVTISTTAANAGMAAGTAQKLLPAITAASTGLQLYSTGLTRVVQGTVVAEQALVPYTKQLLLTGEVIEGAIVSTWSWSSAWAAAEVAFAAGLEVLGGWVPTLALVATGLVLGTEGLEDLGSIAASVTTIIYDFGRDALNALVLGFNNAVEAAGPFSEWMQETIPGAYAVAQAVGGIRGALDSLAIGFKMLADQTSEGNWAALAAALKSSNPIISEFLSGLTAMNAETARQKTLVDINLPSVDAWRDALKSTNTVLTDAGTGTIFFSSGVRDAAKAIDAITLGTEGANRSLTPFTDAMKNAATGILALSEAASKEMTKGALNFGFEEFKKMAAQIPEVAGMAETALRAFFDNVRGEAKKHKDVMEDIAKATAKSLRQIADLTEKTNEERLKRVGTTRDQQIAAIDATMNHELSQISTLDAAWQGHSAAIIALANEQRKNVGLNIATLSDTVANATDAYEREMNTLMEMSIRAGEFTQNQIMHQRDVVDELREHVRTLGDEYGNTFDKAAAKAEALTAKVKKLAQDAADAAQKLHDMGGSMDFDLSTPEGIAFFKKMNPGAFINAPEGYFKDHTLEEGVRAGYVDLMAAFNRGRSKKPGFAEGVRNFSGGPAIVGERGPEMVTLPTGATVTPHASGLGSNVINFHPGSLVLHYPVMNDPKASAHLFTMLSDLILTKLRERGVRVT